MAEKTIFHDGLTDTCARCRFFDSITNIQERTQITVCRSKGPTVYAFPSVAQGPDGQPAIQWAQATVWPIVQATDWCGDFARKLSS